MRGNSEAVFEVANDALAVDCPVQSTTNPQVGEVVGIAGAVAQDQIFRVEKGRGTLGKLAAPLGFKLAVGLKPLVLVTGVDAR